MRRQTRMARILTDLRREKHADLEVGDTAGLGACATWIMKASRGSLFFERGEIFDQIYQISGGHVLLQAGGHDGELTVVAADDFGGTALGDNAADGLHGD